MHPMKAATARALLIVLVCLVVAAPALVEAAEPAARPAVARTPSHLLGIKQVLAALVVGLAGLGVAATILVAAALSPGRVARAAVALEGGRWRVVIVGVLTSALLILACALLGQAGEKTGAAAPLGAVCLVLLGFLAWLVLFGLAAPARLIGRRLIGTDPAPMWKPMLLGGFAVGGTLLIPIIGWVYFVYLAVRGTGAATLALFAAKGVKGEGERGE